MRIFVWWSKTVNIRTESCDIGSFFTCHNHNGKLRKEYFTGCRFGGILFLCVHTFFEKICYNNKKVCKIFFSSESYK